MFKLIYALLITVLASSSAWGACTGGGTSCTKSGTTYTCTDASYGCINDAVTAADAEDTINVTATGSVEWASKLTITKGINLIGPGKANLTITNTYDCSHDGSMIVYTPGTPANNDPFRLSGFTLNGGAKCSILNLNNAASYTDGTMQTKVRVDNNTFAGVYRVGSTRDQAIAVTGMYGVIDNNLFDTIDYPIRFSSGPTSPGTRWQNLTGVQFGAANNNMYLEKNTFTGVGANTGALVDCQAENRYIFRYNTITIAGQVNPLFDMHGNNGIAPDYIQSCFGGEIYGNQVNAGDLAIKFIQQRGGHALVFFNNTDTTYAGTWPVYSQVKQEYGDSLTGHACADESGNYCTTDGEYQHVHDSYYWNNRKGLTTLDGNGTGAIDIQSTFSGSPPPAEGTPVAGVNHLGPATTPAASCGASRPGTCAVGASYWETSQDNCSDLTGYVGTEATPIEGTLYKCTSENTWTAYFTPYTYPHPLRGEAIASTISGMTASGVNIQ